MKSFLQAVAFLTRLPVPVVGDERDWKKSAMWFPMVGLVMGIIFLLFDQLIAIHFPNTVRAALNLAFWVWITGGLHLDGLMDTADGLLSYRDKEQVMEIMKDSRVGAMGVITVVLFLLLKWLALKELLNSPFFIASWISVPIVGRLAVVLGMFFFPYARAQGMGLGLKEGITFLRLGFVFILTNVFIGLLLGWKGIFFALITWGMLCLFAWRVTYRIGGLTGDVYGAMIEGAELLMLLLLIMEGEIPFENVVVTAW